MIRMIYRVLIGRFVAFVCLDLFIHLVDFVMLVNLYHDGKNDKDETYYHCNKFYWHENQKQKRKV